jgi:hypothetical protein
MSAEEYLSNIRLRDPSPSKNAGISLPQNYIEWLDDVARHRKTRRSVVLLDILAPLREAWGQMSERQKRGVSEE